MNAIICLTTLHLHNLQVGSKHRIIFVGSNGPRQLCVVLIHPSLQVSNLNVAVLNFLLGALELEILVCCLPVVKDGPVFGEEIVIGMLDNFELGEIAVFNNFRVYEVGAGWHLEGGKGIVAVNCIMNCSTMVSECLRNVFAQFVS